MRLLSNLYQRAIETLIRSIELSLTLPEPKAKGFYFHGTCNLTSWCWGMRVSPDSNMIQRTELVKNNSFLMITYMSVDVWIIQPPIIAQTTYTTMKHMFSCSVVSFTDCRHTHTSIANHNYNNTTRAVHSRTDVI